MYKIKQGFTLIYGANLHLTTLTEDSRATLVILVFRKALKINNIQIVVRFFEGYRIK